MTIKDFGPIDGHQISVETLDEMCSGEGGRATAEAVVADAQVVGVIGTLCSGAAVRRCRHRLSSARQVYR